MNRCDVNGLQIFIYLGIVIALLTGCSGGKVVPSVRVESDDQAKTDSHEQMLNLLGEVKRRRNEDPVFGTQDLRNSQNRLASLPEGAPVLYRTVQNLMISNAHLRLGNNLEAVRHLEIAIPMIIQMRGEVPEDVLEKVLYDASIACLRLGEVSNCVHCQTGESCILPIQHGGVHQDTTGSDRAVYYLAASLQLNPDNDTARWLLNIAHMTLGTYPDEVPRQFLIPEKQFESSEEFPRFSNIAKSLGIDTVSLSGGVVADDVDGDGWLDLVVSNWDTAGQLKYFHNGADGTFSDQTSAAGLDGLYGGLNMVQADYDNDGDVDILVLRGAWGGLSGIPANSLIENLGGGRFRDVTFFAGLGEKHLPTQTAAWGDYDNDGDLDLYIGNEDYPCQLFENQGDGTFFDVAARAGVENGAFTKAVVWGDYDGDRYPDLYVSNYGRPTRMADNSGESSDDLFAAESGKPNRLYHNNGDGTFTDVAPQLNVTRPLLGFPVWFWDFNNDGALDLFAASYDGEVRDIAAHYLEKPRTTEPHALYQGDGYGGFKNVAKEFRLLAPSLPMGANFGDLDNDGFLDFYLGTGTPLYEGLMPNLMYRNQSGKRFADVTFAGGFGHLQKGHGIAFADLDNDGDQDVFSELGGAFPGDAFADALYENPGSGANWLNVKLVGTKSNRSAIGARIKVTLEDSTGRRNIFRWVSSGGTFGANPLRQEIGLFDASRIESIEVYWPTSDETQSFKDVQVNQFIEITEGTDKIRTLPLRSVRFGGATAVL